MIRTAVAFLNECVNCSRRPRLSGFENPAEFVELRWGELRRPAAAEARPHSIDTIVMPRACPPVRRGLRDTDTLAGLLARITVIEVLDVAQPPDETGLVRLLYVCDRLFELLLRQVLHQLSSSTALYRETDALSKLNSFADHSRTALPSRGVCARVLYCTQHRILLRRDGAGVSTTTLAARSRDQSEGAGAARTAVRAAPLRVLKDVLVAVRRRVLARSVLRRTDRASCEWFSQPHHDAQQVYRAYLPVFCRSLRGLVPEVSLHPFVHVTLEVPPT